MKFPRYWAKGTTTTGHRVRHPFSGQPLDGFESWGWSDVSVEDARRRGSERADAVVAEVLRGHAPDRYAYGTDRPFREPVLEEMADSDGSPLAVVSRNSYGCLVLNTTDVMFVDVDVTPRPEGLLQGLKRLFGGAGPTPVEVAEAEALERLRLVAGADSSMGVRVYRTFAGLRYLMTHRRVDPTAAATHQLMAELGADPLYIRLCQTQSCFRARLTPKPWRSGIAALRVDYPWRDAEAESEAARWLDEYARVAADFSTCALVEEIGPRVIDPDIVRIVDFHDRATGVGSDRPLA